MEKLLLPQFPRANAYHPDWIVANASGGANSLWLTEWLTSALDLKPGMRILDLGCGRACSSIFLAREFDVTVWATDLWFDATENLKRIQDTEVDGRVFPIHCDARNLPFASNFFDAILSIDAYPYFGTDDHYLNYLARLVKSDGVIAIAGAGFLKEVTDEVPDHLAAWLKAEPAVHCLHSAAWWKRHWLKTGVVDVELAESMPDGWKLWLDWHRTIAPDNELEIRTVESDAGRNLTYYRVVARRRRDAVLAEPISSIPPSYSFQPLVR